MLLHTLLLSSRLATPFTGKASSEEHQRHTRQLRAKAASLPYAEEAAGSDRELVPPRT